MKKFNKIVLALGAMTMLASCGKTVTAAEAQEIAASWAIDGAVNVFKTVKTVSKDSKGNKEENVEDNATTINVALTAMITANKTLVAGLKDAEGCTYKANGKALELSYKDADKTYVYRINEYGITTYTKTTNSDGSWSEDTITLTKK